jgi:hypothetical protein
MEIEMDFTDEHGRRMQLAFAMPQGTITFMVYRPNEGGGSIELSPEQYRQLGEYLLGKADFGERMRANAEKTRAENSLPTLASTLSPKKSRVRKRAIADVFIPASP